MTVSYDGEEYGVEEHRKIYGSKQAAHLCPTLWDPMDCKPLGSSARGILQARILEWVAISFSRESSWTWVSCITGRFFTIRATREA